MSNAKKLPEESGEIISPTTVKNHMKIVKSSIPQVASKVMIDELCDQILELDDSQFKRGGQASLIINKVIQTHITNSPLSDKYNFLFLHLTPENRCGAIDDVWGDRLFETLNKGNLGDKPILLQIYTAGGDPNTAYKIAKWINHFAIDNNFQISIPEKSKSAGTLLSLGSKVIHMGLRSELGPIDPQHWNEKANSFTSLLGVTSFIKHISEDIKIGSEDTADMLAKFMAQAIDPNQLAEATRSPWAFQKYAETLLSKRLTLKDAQFAAASLVHKFTYHGYVIDYEEAVRLLGTDMVKFNTAEYQLANKIHKDITQLNFATKFSRKNYDKRTYHIHLCGDSKESAYFYDTEA